MLIHNLQNTITTQRYRMVQKLSDILMSIHEYSWVLLWGPCYELLMTIIWQSVLWSCCHIHVVFNYHNEQVPRFTKLHVVIMFTLNTISQWPTSWTVVSYLSFCWKVLYDNYCCFPQQLTTLPGVLNWPEEKSSHRSLAYLSLISTVPASPLDM